MHPRLIRCAAFLIVPPLLSLATRAAFADGDDNRTAIALAYEGRELFDAADYEDALTKFRLARARADSPVFDLYIARSLEKLGKWVEALKAYEHAAYETAQDVPEPWQEAREAARREGQALDAIVPRLTLSANVPATELTLRIDGHAVAWPVAGRALDPGPHRLLALWRDQRFEQTLLAEASHHLRVALPFSNHATAKATPGDGAFGSEDSRAHPVDASEKEKGGGGGWSPWVWASLGVAATGLSAGIVTGTVALVRTSQLKAHCDENPCPNGEPADHAQSDKKGQTERLALLSNIGFGVAAAGAALGITLILLEGSKGETDDVAWRIEATGSDVRLKVRF